MIMSDRRDLDGHLQEVDAVLGEPVDHRAERFAQRGLANVLEAEIGAAGRRAAPGLHFLQDRIGRLVARDDILRSLRVPVVVHELAHLGVQQPAAELVAERIPHDRIHADKARREMADREELHELHVDELGPRAQRQRMAVATHVRRGAVAPIETRESARGEHHGAGRNRDGPSVGDREADRAARYAVLDHEVRDVEVADARDLALPLHARAQRLRHGRAGGEEVHIDAARPVVPRRVRGADRAVRLARPADVPGVHLPDGARPILAEQRRKPGVAEPASCRQRIGEMMLPVIRHVLAERGRHGHLRHDGRAAAPDQAAVDEQHADVLLRGRERGRHAGAARADDEHVGREMGGLFGHVKLRLRFDPHHQDFAAAGQGTSRSPIARRGCARAP